MPDAPDPAGSPGQHRKDQEGEGGRQRVPGPTVALGQEQEAVCAAAQEDTLNTTQRSPSARARAGSQSSQAPQTSQHLEAPAELPQPEFCQKDSY